jgi:hypothetical protein
MKSHKQTDQQMTDQQYNRPTIIQLDKCASWQRTKPAINKRAECFNRNVRDYNWKWAQTIVWTMILDSSTKHTWQTIQNYTWQMTSDSGANCTWQSTKCQCTNLTHNTCTIRKPYKSRMDKEHMTSEQSTTIHLDKPATGDIANGCHANVQITNNSCTFLENTFDRLAFHIWQLY